MYVEFSHTILGERYVVRGTVSRNPEGFWEFDLDSIAHHSKPKENNIELADFLDTECGVPFNEALIEAAIETAKDHQ